MKLLAPLLALLPLALAADSDTNTTACNSSPTLCPLPYSSILHLGAHNSAFIRTSSNHNSTAANQAASTTSQLSAGVRLLQSQLHVESGAIKLCHTSCQLFDAGDFSDWLGEINTWLTAERNRNEVVTLLLVNDDKIAASKLAAEFDKAGLSDLAYVPDGSGWPTLQDMIANNTRLVTFLSQAADTAAVPYLLP